jgi:hypothetical protein
MAKRFQFSLRDMLIAMFWLSICSGSFVWLIQTQSLVGLFLFIASPFIAVGALLGNAPKGAVIGFGFALIVLGLLLAYIAFVFRNFV